MSATQEQLVSALTAVIEAYDECNSAGNSWVIFADPVSEAINQARPLVTADVEPKPPTICPWCKWPPAMFARRDWMAPRDPEGGP